MTATDLPPEIEKLIGQVQYEEAGEFPVEQGYVYTTCSSVENGNPLFWDEAVANDLTNGPIAPRLVAPCASMSAAALGLFPKTLQRPSTTTFGESIEFMSLWCRRRPAH